MSKKYNDYLKSEHWLKIRKIALNFYGNKCGRCCESDVNRLNVHHKNYYNLHNEDVKLDLFVLCKNCHEAYHELSTKTKNSTTIAFSKGCVKLKDIEKNERKNWEKRSKKSKEKYIKAKTILHN